MFRQISAAFQRDQLNPDQYYEHFRSLFQTTDAPVGSMWMQLVDLLPDFHKRYALQQVR
jgi:hypothetical protein